MSSTYDIHDTHAPVVENEVAALHRLLDEQRRVLAEQTRMLQALDARREEIEELVVDMMPVANSAMLMATRALEAAEGSTAKGWAVATLAELSSVRDAPAPGLRELLRRLRTPDVRRGVALALTLLAAVGSARSPVASTTAAKN